MIFIRGILGETRFAEKRMLFFCDNHGTIKAALRAGFRGSTKDVDIQFERKSKYYTEIIESKYINVEV